MPSTSATLVETKLLSPNPHQPRGKISEESLEELAQSIKEHGILEPIVVADTPAGLQIIAGERRWRAAMLIKMEKVPVVIRRTNPVGMLQMAVVENVQRTELNPIERAYAYKRMLEDFRMSLQEISKKIGKSSSYISNTIRFLTLADAVKDGLIAGEISEGHAKAISSLTVSIYQIEVYKQVLKRNLNVRDTEELVRRYMKGVMGDLKRGVRTEEKMSEIMEKIQADVSHKLGGSFKISRTSRRTQMIIVLPGSQEETELKMRRIYKLLMGF